MTYALAVPLGISLVFAVVPGWMPQFRSAKFRAWPEAVQRRRIRLVRVLGIVASILIIGMCFAVGAIEGYVEARTREEEITKMKPAHTPKFRQSRSVDAVPSPR
jgi:hypothetical protein